MKFTNNHNLPESFVNFVRADKYSRGDADISVTQLIDSPRVRLLRNDKADEMETDVSDRVWSLFGTAVHHVLESTNASHAVTMEERLFMEVDGWKLSGAIDHQEIIDGKVYITDYKVTSVWSVLLGTKREWELQQNIYAQMVRETKGLEIGGIRICAIIRDWSRREAQFKPEYPNAPVAIIDLPLWDEAMAHSYIRDRINVHQDAQVMWDFEEAEVECDDYERWAKKDVFAVMKKNQKRAVKLFDEHNDAIQYLKDSGMNSDALFIETRKGEYTRCEGDYCSVSEYCTQFATEKVLKEL